MREEKWRPCYETDDYEVSDEGRIRNAKTGRVLKTQFDKRGRETLTLRIDGVQQTRSMSRLVGEAFYGDECDGKDIFHRDGNRSNNRLDNLRVGTRSETVRNSYDNGREQTHKMRPVRCVETGEEWESIVEASRDTGLNRRTISRCANSPFLNTRDGLHFEFL